MQHSFLKRSQLRKTYLVCLYPLVSTLLTGHSATGFGVFQVRNTSAHTLGAASMQATETGSKMPSNTLGSVREALDNSWVRQLSSESPQNLLKSRKFAGLPEDDDNRRKRPVYNGHYVLVKPTGLSEPRLVLFSQDVAHGLLQLTDEQIESDDFLQWVSGNLVLGDTWATPYALSIMGTRYTNNCPYGTGDGYGDGRAVSIAEFNGHELQLKGGGTTPFHRGADGRAVLRSSIREFLASEAMHYLGISTTRALSLVVSEKDKIHRPWYSEDARLRIPSMNDQRLARYPEEERRAIIEHLRTQKADPNIMITEKAAITCRVAPSFTRVGHLDLFARRAERASMRNAPKTNSNFDTSTDEWKELEQMIWHACYREYRTEAYDPYIEKNDIAAAATAFLDLAAERIAAMVAGWVRVGFAQGNFNADNCLVAGRTMDYGPFGWMEEYNPVFAKWTGSGNHFGFLNQPGAGYANYGVLVESVAMVVSAYRGDDDSSKAANEFLARGKEIFERKIDEIFRQKLGFLADQDVADDLWQDGLEKLMRTSRTDWTVFWRRLTFIMRDFDSASQDYERMLAFLEAKDETRDGASPFYVPLTDEKREEWKAWIEKWRKELRESGSSETAYERTRLINPKFVLREWMLVEAYSDAANDLEAELFSLYSLIQRPYDEGSDFEEKKYFRRAPDAALTTGGTAFMS